MNPDSLISHTLRSGNKMGAQGRRSYRYVYVLFVLLLSWICADVKADLVAVKLDYRALRRTHIPQQLALLLWWRSPQQQG